MKYLLYNIVIWLVVIFFIGDYGFAQEIEVSFTGGCLTGAGTECFIVNANQPNYSLMSIAQDILLSATYMVGTVLTIVIIYCGLGYVFAARGGKDINKYKNGLKKAMIGVILVWGAYVIVRLIQYIAKG